ncbi:MAG: MarR family transcriptional regulator [Coriobacteriales bacterium]|jgi:DNA-binding MarR family transcriptional regulator|nr:MarR family transcriptional regulator [Coriobacteriales bacterium]
MGNNLGYSFLNVYAKFKLHFYRKIFRRFESREASLSAVETFCVEVIYALGAPTVGEFASFIDISQANAAYKIQSLARKGYVAKVRSEDDRREYHLHVTEKFLEYNRLNTNYVETVVQRIEKRFSPAEVKSFKQMLDVISNELMTEMPNRIQVSLLSQDTCGS